MRDMCFLLWTTAKCASWFLGSPRISRCFRFGTGRLWPDRPRKPRPESIKGGANQKRTHGFIGTDARQIRSPVIGQPFPSFQLSNLLAGRHVKSLLSYLKSNHSNPLGFPFVLPENHRSCRIKRRNLLQLFFSCSKPGYLIEIERASEGFKSKLESKWNPNLKWNPQWGPTRTTPDSVPQLRNSWLSRPVHIGLRWPIPIWTPASARHCRDFGWVGASSRKPPS